MKNFHLAWRFLRRELWSGEWFVIFIALFIAVSATTALHFYTERLTRGIEQQGAKVLGGNLVVSSSTPLPIYFSEKARSLHLQTAEVWSYPSMISVKNQLQLINVQAVSENYPLLGPASGRPEKNTIWIDPRLFSLLGVNVKDSASIGSASFQITRAADATMYATGWLIAPRVIMRLEDVPKTRTVIPGSRVDYRLLIAGNKNAVQQFRAWVTPELQLGQRLLDIYNQQSGLNNVIEQTEHYLQLALLVCLMMTGTAIAFSVQLYLKKQYATVALWRCFGATEQQIVQVFLWRLLIVAFVSGLMGILAGYFLQALFVNLFKSYLPLLLPPIDYQPIFLGFSTGGFLLFVFAYPLLSEFPRTSPLYLWRDKVNINVKRDAGFFVIACACFLGFFYWFMDFSLLVLFFLNAFIVSIGFMYLISLLVLKLLKRFLRKTKGAFRQGLSQLVHHPERVSLQITAFTLILMGLFLLDKVQSNLIGHWQETLPTGTPNYFVINIAPTDIGTFNQFLQSHQVNPQPLYPLVRGRLVALNGKPILTAIPVNARGNNALHRELNLSYMWEFPADNKIVAGDEWSEEDDKGKALVSVEKKLADNLGLKLGDQLTFSMGETTVSATIASIRTLEWTSFHPNFFMIFTPGVLDNLPTTYMTSIYLSADQTGLLNQLVQNFPNVTVIDVASLLQQIQVLVNKVSSAMQYLFFFALAIGVLILWIAFQASLDERQVTYRLFRVLGASNRYIRITLCMEFLTMFGVILVLSYVLAESTGFIILSKFFNI